MTEMEYGPPSIVEISPVETRLEVRPRYQIIELTAPGPQGPQGPPGSIGGTRHVHTQNTAAGVWTVNHGLGYEPLFSTVIVDGTDVTDGVDIFHINLNSLTISFSQPVSGKAAFQ